MESSTTNATTGIRTLKRRKDQVAILEQRLFDQNNTQRWRESYHRHVGRANLRRTYVIRCAVGVGTDQASSDCARSSMAISLNSLDSKTSPHSRHSTYSVSSSRLTICTRGCLH